MLFKRAIIFSLFTFRSVVTAAEFDWDCINFIDTCNNACFAIHCKGAAATLTYDSDKENGGPRRDASGCNARPCMTINYDQYGDSCNEYPFASVKEGGKDVILRCVDMSDNASQGAQLGSFEQNLKDGDQFLVFVKNYVGAPYCKDDDLSDNDGGEFVKSGDDFVNAKSRRGLKTNFIPTLDVSKSPLSKFTSDDEQKRLWLSRDRNNTVINREL